MSEDLEMTISFFILDFRISREKSIINFIFSGPYRLPYIPGLMDINFTYHHLHVASLSCILSLNLSFLVPFLFIFILPPFRLVLHCTP